MEIGVTGRHPGYPKSPDPQESGPKTGKKSGPKTGKKSGLTRRDNLPEVLKIRILCPGRILNFFINGVLATAISSLLK
jgi:hypothetical protein